MAGMHGVALGSGIEPAWKKDDIYIPEGQMEKGESVELRLCSEEVSRDAKEILQERHIASNPMKAYTRMCSESLNPRLDSGDGKPKFKRDEGKGFADRLRQLMPICVWAPNLTKEIVKADLIAGLTVGVMVIPQSMSYGAIAGLPYINGMYSACVPTLVYALFGQSRQLAVGPVAMVSLLVEAGLNGALGEDCNEAGKPQYEVCPEQYVALACLTAFVVGFLQIVASILRLGFLVSFLGHPVISGFTSGAAIIIALSQLKYLLGFDIPKSQYIYDTVINVCKDLGKTQGMPLFLGLATLGFLMANKKLAAKYAKLKMFGPMGPLIACVFGSVLLLAAPVLHDEYNVSYVGEIPMGLFPLSVSAWRLDKLPDVIATALSSCLIGYMESIAIGKNLAAKHGYEIEAGQEMFSLGMANLIGAAFSCYPVTGSFSRSAVNNSTGALSQLSGVITAVVMFLTLLFLTPAFYYLPKFVLAAIVMNSVIPLVAFGEAKHLLSVKKNDFFLWLTAFFGTLFLGVLEGILVAVGVSLMIVIYESVRPQITILWRIPGTTIYRNMKQESSGSFVPNVFIARLGSSLYFANASFVKDMLLAYVNDIDTVNKTEYLVLELTPVISIDSTACHVIKDIVNDFRNRDIQVAFAMVGNRVDKTLRKAHLKGFIGEQWFFPNVEEAVSYCLKHQKAKRLRAAQKDISDVDAHDTDGDGLDITGINVVPGNEIGFSNDLHASCTMVFISLVKDVPMIMSDLTQVFKRNQITIVRAQIDPMHDDCGAKHIYFIKSIRSGSKLSEVEIQRAREDLEVVLERHKIQQGQPEVAEIGRSTSVDDVNISTGNASPDRLQRLEEALFKQQKTSEALEARLSSIGGSAVGCGRGCLPGREKLGAAALAL